VELTAEIAAERGRTVDLEGFAAHMAEQRARARAAHQAAGGGAGAPVELYREILEEAGPTDFTGRREVVTTGARIVALVRDGERVRSVGPGDEVQVFCDRTPFYAEAGGQVGDVGEITTASGTVAEVTDTRYALPGTLVAHLARVRSGELVEGDEVELRIDAARRDAIRRNHTATHLLHWALREVLGPHVQQAGSLVAPDRLRFDFSHPRALTPEEIEAVEELANREVLTDAPVRHYETTMEHARELGALAFFDERYGDLVRVLEAGERSIELCGGTHVHALGFIGPIKIVGESSIGANLRRIEAVTGEAALARIRDEERQLRRLATDLGVAPTEVAERVEALLAQLKAANAELAARRRAERAARAAELAAGADDGLVTARLDGLPPDELREVALGVRDRLGSGVVVVAGAPGPGKASVVVAATPDRVADGVSAGEVAAAAAKLLGGGAARNPELSVGGGTRPEAIDDALAEAARLVRDTRRAPSAAGG
jgi:alanyl-tRNA synthetase